MRLVDAPETDQIRAARELREARVREARKNTNWTEIGGVTPHVLRLFTGPDGELLRPFFGETFDKGKPLVTPELRFIVGENDSIAFFEVLPSRGRRT